MNTYKVRGLYTISFEMEVEANSREEAEEMAMDVDIDTESEWFGRFYVIEADNTIKGTAGYHSTDIGQGLYVFGADLNPIANKDGKYGLIQPYHAGEFNSLTNMVNFIEYEMWQYVEQRHNYLGLRDRLYEILEGKEK